MEFVKIIKLRVNGRNNSQHRQPNIVGSCCVRLHLAKRLTGIKLCATTPNNTQQHATGCANGTQHVTSHNVAKSVCRGLQLQSTYSNICKEFNVVFTCKSLNAKQLVYISDKVRSSTNAQLIPEQEGWFCVQDICICNSNTHPDLRACCFLSVPCFYAVVFIETKSVASINRKACYTWLFQAFKY